MPLLTFKCTDFRCLAAAEFEADPHYTLIHGPNASGKTSLLEAIGYLGRGKSFRGASTQELIRHGQSAFVLHGTIASDARTQAVGVRNSREGFEVSIDGDRNGGAEALAAALPLQIVDPEIHELVAGGPEKRRRYLDWIAFHVERGYLARWRRFRRALRQRNAALRDGAAGDELGGWDHEFVTAALEIHAARERALEITGPALEETGSALLGVDVSYRYQQGWASGQPLDAALRDGLARDQLTGSSQQGPQRADLRLMVEDHRARKRVSRGQQKLLACTLILAATEIAQAHLERPLLLLLDDPAAELDAESLARLMTAVTGLGSQVIATALGPDAALLGPHAALFPEPPALFHVEQGVLRKVP